MSLILLFRIKVSFTKGLNEYLQIYEKIQRTDVLDRINEDCKNHILSDKTKKSQLTLGETAEREKLDREMPVRVEIEGDGGNILTSFKPDTLKPEDLPRKIDSISANNNAYYTYSNPGKSPDNFFSLKIDFSKVDILNLNNSNSQKTYGFIEAQGSSETWVDGSFASLEGIFKPTKSLHFIFHRKYSYDFALWILFIPILIVAFIQNYPSWHENLPSMPVALESVILLFAFLFFILLFRLTFNMIQYIYPYHELTLHNERRSKSRLILNFIIITLLGAAITAVSSVFIKIFTL